MDTLTKEFLNYGVLGLVLLCMLMAVVWFGRSMWDWAFGDKGKVNLLIDSLIAVHQSLAQSYANLTSHCAGVPESLDQLHEKLDSLREELKK